MDILRKFAFEEMRMDMPSFRTGDTVRVHVRIRESADKERIQVFEGVVISRKGSGISETFIVRKISYGMGVERIFPVHSPIIEKVEIMTEGRHNRSKMYYLRGLRGKAVRQKVRKRS